LNKIQRVFAYDFEGNRFDVGEKLGFVKTTIEFALQHEDLQKEVIEVMEELLKKYTL
jgi:UTP--glucose-1-phosphate uridylyltransferase